MAIRWTGIKQRKISQLKLSGSFRARLTKPHVLALAESIQRVGRINLPAVCVKLGKETRWEVAAGEDRIAAELVANGGKADAIIWVRVFNADTEQELREVRAHENAHRRHDDRDKWLASLAAPNASNDDLTQNSEDLSGPSPVNPDQASEATAGGDDKGKEAPGSIPAQAPPSALDPSDNIAQGFDDDPPAWGGDIQQAGSPAVPKQPVTVESPREKGARRKEAAELATAVTGKKVTPAAIKQAEHRERKRAGLVNPRQKHDDGGPTLPEAAMPVLKAYIDADSWLGQTVVRLGNLLREHPELEERDLGVRLEAAKKLRKELKADQPFAPCVFCFGAGEKAACNVCRGLRWINKAELDAAPAEVRKAAGL